MTSMNMATARAKLAEAIDTAQTEAVVIERRGVPAAVLVSPSQYELMLEAVENAEDVAAFDEAIADGGDNIPWDQIRADLGWA